MAGEPILIVDDTPVNLKLTRLLLVNEGFQVLTASSAEEALDLLRGYRPQLVLADIQLPGIDGLELTRRLKRDNRTSHIAVVALTAFAMRGDEQKAIDAGCDGYITKPVDTRTLGASIRKILDQRAETCGGPVPPPSAAPEADIPPSELHALRHRFLEEGQAEVRHWLLNLDGELNANDAARAVHQWIGAAGLLGYTAISRLARETEAVLVARPIDQNQLRESLTTLALAFGSPRDARDLPVPEMIRRSLGGRQMALVGLSASDGQRLAVSLERAGAAATLIDPGQPLEAGTVRAYDAAVVQYRPDTAGSPWLKPWVAETLALVLAGTRDHLLEMASWTQSVARELLMDPWQADEALLRLSLALHQERGATCPDSPALSQAGRAQVLVADDDPTVRALVANAIRNFGMDCETAANGPSAVDAARRLRPQVAVLDVNMPGMDGFEVLAAIRAEQIPVRVLLLTARQQETDVLRGFTLGADDYVVKPFSPLELVARLKRLLQ